MNDALAHIERIQQKARMTAVPQEPTFEADDPAVAHLRVPPHSREAEQSVLGGLLLDNAALARITDILVPTDFYRHEHRTIYGAIAELIGSGAAADVITVFERLEGEPNDFGGLQYLNALSSSVPSAANIRRYAEIVAERASLRRLISLTDELASKAFQHQPCDQLLDEAKVALAQLAENRGPGRSQRVPLLGLDQLREVSHSMTWLIKHIVPAESMGLVFGASGTFKSFITLDCALHVAHGLPWMGRRTKQGSVLYIAGEGGSGLWPRIVAWHRARRIPWEKVPLFIVPMAVNLSSDAWRVVEAAQARGVTPSMVVVDTLSQTYAGEENSANEMAAYLRELGTRFKQLWHCAVLLVHHTGHNTTERPRGSSAIQANTDFLFGVCRDEKEMLATFSCVHRKDGDPFDDATFSLSTQFLGTDEDGDRINSLVARHLSSAEEVGDALDAESQAGRGGAHQLLLSLMQNGMRELELRKVFYDECGKETADARRQAYHRSKTWAIKQGFLEVAQGTVITLKKGK